MKNDKSDQAMFASRVILQLSESYPTANLACIYTAELTSKAIRPILQKGLQLHSWDLTHLEEMAALLPTEENFSRLELGLRSEAAFTPIFVDQLEKSHRESGLAVDTLPTESGKATTIRGYIRRTMTFRGPRGWQDWRKAYLLNHWLDALEDRGRWKVSAKHNSKPDSYSSLLPLGAFHPLAHVFNPAIKTDCLVYSLKLRATERRMMRIAIELEKSYLKKGRYPDSLEEVSISFPIVDLTDPRAGDLKYRKTDDGYFTIWSEHQEEVQRDSLSWKFSETK